MFKLGNIILLLCGMAMIISAVTVKSKTIAPPSPTMFQCRDYQIPIHLKCDGLKQCVPDGVDEVDCPAPTTPVKSILVATGESLGDGYSSDAHVVIPNDPNTCSLPPLPKAFSDGTGGVIGNAIILCGGYNVFDEEVRLSTCHIFDNNSKSWKTTEMASKRSDLASAPLNGALWISGGFDGNGGRLSTSELVYGNGTIGPGPTLPSEMSYHCSVEMENGKVMLINDDGQVLIYDASTESFSDGPSTFKSRIGHPACALFRSPAHGNRAVVFRVNGRGKNAEVFDYTRASEWEQISDLPINTVNPAAITSLDGKGVYVQNSKNFYELDCSTECKWNLMSQTLPKSALSAIMMYLPPDVTCFF